jgi:hypothetical protein
MRLEPAILFHNCVLFERIASKRLEAGQKHRCLFPVLRKVLTTGGPILYRRASFLSV